ncbi:MAG: tRNA lysidine(34) synthetase TilS [Candidatus Symbiothrix sp.]|jgi:tRNA(Ile)-lysidine synthase|nr:tRNA lysidine(34) synthetase TilS [Candidatus Symbiothrix sp.]
MIQKVRKYIEEQGLLPTPPSKIIVGLSGGADSVVLLYLLHQLGYECIAAHCNFHLRGEESQRDETFATALAAAFNIPFIKQDFDTASVAREKGISIEMAARDLRYEWFEQLRKDENAGAIAVAHHRDDSIETMLLNLIRGTGIKGLTGIKPKNGTIIRPLLCVPKKEILQFATGQKLPYIIDSSNLQDDYTRNKIRLSLMPLLQSLNPSIDLALLRTMENLSEIEKIYNQSIFESETKVFNREKGTIDIARLQALPSPEAVLFEILKQYGFGRERIQDIARAMQSQSGKEFYSQGYTLLKDREQFLLSPREQKSGQSVYFIDIHNKEIHSPVSIHLSFEAISPELEIIKDPDFTYFDAGKLRFPLQIRKWEKGDKFIPFGMKGFQKLSDYFNNHKFSKPEKENTWLLCSGNDIIWIIGHRTDDRYKVNQETKKVCILKVF